MTLPAVDTIRAEYDAIIEARAGDRRAFGDLVRRHRTSVVNVVYRMCGDPDLAEDAAQETFVRAWEHLNSFHMRPGTPAEDGGRVPNHSFRNWLFRIATNCALDELRRRRPTSNVDDLSLQDGRHGPERIAEESERAAAVRSAVLALPEASRSALILREYEGLSYRDIADALDIPMGTVMSRLNYARRQLREQLADYLEVE
jgi:RNA polymerase sigma-70 factor (ECF subfamily)